jgi:hypothetical protein
MNKLSKRKGRRKCADDAEVRFQRFSRRFSVVSGALL